MSSLMILSICLSSCGVPDTSVNSKNIDSIKVENLPKKNQSNNDVLIDFAKVKSQNYINELEKILNIKSIKISEVGDCGGFFSENEGDIENILLLGNMGINAMDNKAIITSVVNIPDNFKIIYNNFIINNNFKMENLPPKKYEIFLEKNKSNQYFSVNGSEEKVLYNIVYIIREKDNDDLIYAYYLDKKLVALNLSSPC